MKKLWIAGLLGLALTLSHHSLSAAEKVDLGAPPEMVKRMRLVNAVAEIEKLDLAKRRVTIRRPDGVHQTIKVGEEVKGLDSFKEGDTVKIRYYESTTYSLAKVDAKKVKKETTVHTSESLPAGGKKETLETTVIATVKEIDPQGRFVKLNGPDGDFSIPVKDPKNIEALKVGDQVRITYEESLAISLLKHKK